MLRGLWVQLNSLRVGIGLPLSQSRPPLTTPVAGALRLGPIPGWRRGYLDPSGM